MCTTSANKVLGGKFAYGPLTKPKPRDFGKGKRKHGEKNTTTQIVGPSLMAAYTTPQIVFSLTQLKQVTCCSRRGCLKQYLTQACLTDSRKRLTEAVSGVLRTKREVAWDLIHLHGCCNRAVELICGLRR